MTNNGPKVRELIPLIWVKDIEATVSFYRDRLGFQMAASWEEDGKLNWCRMERDGAALMFQKPHHGHINLDARPRGVILYFICDDAEAMYTDLMARGLTPKPPTTVSYGMRQVTVFDPNGYEVCFESQVTEAPSVLR